RCHCSSGSGMNPMKSTKKKRKPTADALAIIDRRYFENRPERLADLAEARANDTVAKQICALRAKAGLSQRQLAKLVRTTASAICRLEDADYEGHSLSILNRIAAALNQRVEIRFLPLRVHGVRSKTNAKAAG